MSVLHVGCCAVRHQETRVQIFVPPFCLLSWSNNTLQEESTSARPVWAIRAAPTDVAQ